jgi:ribose 5-phosphate isomerase
MMSVAGAAGIMNAPMNLSPQDQWKKAAAEAAAKLVESGMVVGLGTGSTAAFLVSALGRRVAGENLRITAIPTSERTAEQARSLNISLTTFAEYTEIDLTVDGADEVLPGPLYLIKGHGGALLREKIVAAASKRMVVVADQTKIVGRLGSLVSVPVEVVPYGWQATQKKNLRCVWVPIKSRTSPMAAIIFSTARLAQWVIPNRSRTTSITWSEWSSTGCF